MESIEALKGEGLKDAAWLPLQEGLPPNPTPRDQEMVALGVGSRLSKDLGWSDNSVVFVDDTFQKAETKI